MKRTPQFSRVLYLALVKVIQNLASKKFMVFITCTALLCLGFLTPELYVPIALAVLGVETALDWKRGRQGFTDLYATEKKVSTYDDERPTDPAAPP